MGLRGFDQVISCSRWRIMLPENAAPNSLRRSKLLREKNEAKHNCMIERQPQACVLAQPPKWQSQCGIENRLASTKADTPGHLNLILLDGTPVIARPLVPEDRAALSESYRRLSPKSRYNRFWTHTGEMVGDLMLDRVLQQDPATHATWTVLDPTREFSPMAGASWWRDAKHPADAERSFIVLDDDQGRGIGTLLLVLMWLTA